MVRDPDPARIKFVEAVTQAIVAQPYEKQNILKAMTVDKNGSYKVSTRTPLREIVATALEEDEKGFKEGCASNDNLVIECSHKHPNGNTDPKCFIKPLEFILMARKCNNAEPGWSTKVSKGPCIFTFKRTF